MAETRIIRLGIVIDNNDPKSLGRIRFKELTTLTGPKEGALIYEPWSDKDLFCALPFLPINMNLIPEKDQVVKIISYDTINQTTNQEYISGPFSSSHDLSSQTITDQIQNTSYGANAVKQKDIKDKNGNYRNKKSEGSITKNEDFSISGKYGSDIRFTENGVVLRGGHLLSKGAANPITKDLISNVPIMSRKFSNLYLKKFSKTMTIQPEVEEIDTVQNSLLKFIIEYDVDSLTNPTKVNFYLFKVHKNPLGSNIYDTNSFTEFTDLNISSDVMTLVNISGGTLNVPTLSFDINSIEEAYKEIRHILFSLHEDGLSGVSTEVNQGFYNKNEYNDVHPFFFRPTKEFKERTSQIDDKLKVINNVKVRVVGPGHGLLWSTTQISPPTKKIKKEKLVTKVNTNSPEQSFGSIITDKFYLLSTDTNEAGKSINFNELGKYELSQDDYIQKIQPNTYSVVRGENLLNLLYSIINVLVTHVHNINSPYARQDYEAHKKLIELYEKMENDLLNKSIRIN